MHYRSPRLSSVRIPFSPVIGFVWLKLGNRLLTSLAGTALALGIASLPARANDPASAPPQIKDVLARIDTAAGSRDLPQVMQFYAPNFSNSDGLNRQGLEQFLARLWKDYPQLSYRTELVSWQQEGSTILAETITRIEGVQRTPEREFRLKAVLRSRQRVDDRRVIQQDILAEQTQVTSGANPPTVIVKLPDQVVVGQQYSFDAIVQEPLGGDFLLGAVTDEAVQPDRYFISAPTNLEPLASGGIFKLGQAPKTKDNRWISAILVRQGGITVVTQRLRIVDR